MPLDYDDLTNGVAEARNRNISDDEILSHLASKSDAFKQVKERGLSLQQTLDYLGKQKQTQGGEISESKPKQNQPQADSQSYAGRASDQQGQSSAQAGSYAPPLLRPDDGQVRGGSNYPGQRQRNSNQVQLSNAQENTQTQGQRTQEGQEARQGIRGQIPSGDKEEVTSGGVQPSSTQSKVIAGLGSLAESASQLAGFHFGGKAALGAATKLASRKAAGTLIGEAVVAPIAAAEEAATAGLATPLAIGTEVLGGLAGGWIAEKLEGLGERLTGVHGDIEKAKQENPLLSQVVNYSVMAPLGLKSAKNLIQLATKEGKGAALGAVGIGAGLGAATYPLQVGVDKTLNYLTGQTDQENMSWRGLAESTAFGGLLAGAGLPETGKAIKGIDETQAAQNKIKQDAKDPDPNVENAFSEAEKHIENEDRKSAAEALAKAKTAKENNPASGEIAENREHRQEFLQQQIDATTPKPSETETKKPETSGIPPVEGEPPVGEAEVKAEGGITPGVGESKEEVEPISYTSPETEKFIYEGKEPQYTGDIKPENYYGKTAREGFDQVSKDENISPDIRAVADVLSKFPSEGLDKDIIIPTVGKKWEKRAYRSFGKIGLPQKGSWGRPKGLVEAGTLIHEGLHSMTVGELEKQLGHPSVTGKDYDNHLKQKEADPSVSQEVKRLIKLYRSTLDQLGVTNLYLGGRYLKDVPKQSFMTFLDMGHFSDAGKGHTFVHSPREYKVIKSIFNKNGIKFTESDNVGRGGKKINFDIADKEKVLEAFRKESGTNVQQNFSQRLLEPPEKGKPLVKETTPINKWTVSGLVIPSEKVKATTKGIATNIDPKTTIRKGGSYGLGNLFEFISMTFEDKDFQKKLKALKGDGNKSMWESFLDIISKIFKFPKNSMAESVADASLSIAGLRKVQGMPEKIKMRGEPPKVKTTPAPKGNRLHEAAFQLENGVRFIGENHDEALKKALDAGAITKDFYDQVSGNENAKNRNSKEFGFTTNYINESGNREFVDRKQGHEISSKSNQLLVDEPTFPHPEGGYYLHSNETMLDAYSRKEETKTDKAKQKVEQVTEKKDPLQELSQKIRESSTAKPTSSVVDLAKTAENISKEITAGKDAVTTGVTKAKGAFEAMKNAYLNRPAWTDFKNALGKWSLADNQTSFVVRKAVTQIKKAIPDDLRREAITNWIQAGGDEALLRERADKSKPKFKKGYEAALTLTPEEKAHAQDISKYLSDMLEEGINSGMLNHGVENYINQVWKKENPVTQKLQASLQGGKLNKNFPFAKKRIFDSYFEGEQAGYEPASKDVASLIAAYDLSFRKTQAVRAFVKSMRDGKAEDGMPLVKFSGYAKPIGEQDMPPNAYLIKPEARPEGAVTADGRPYVSINHPAFKGWKWAMQDEKGAPVYMESDMLVHPDIANQVKNLTSTSWFKANRVPVLSSAVNGLLKFSSILKQTKLSLSLFHLDQEGLHSLFHRINPANLEEIDLSNETQNNLVSHGLQLADFHSQELFSEGLAGGGLVGKIPVIGKAQTWFNDFLFKDYIPKLKMNMATHALERNVERYKDKLSMDQIYELTAHEANAAFGELNYKFMARNQTVQDILRLFLLAPDFLEARSRFVAQALMPYGAEQRAALALMGVSLYVAGRVLNQALDQNPHWDKPFSVFHEGREYRLRTVLGDVSELVDKPNTFFMNRLSPFGRTGVEFLTGRDSRGIKRNAIEQAEDFLSWFVPIPAQAQPSSTKTSELLSSMGLSNYQHMDQTDTYDAADKWLKKQSDPRIQTMVKKKEEATFAESDYKQLKSALLANNMDFAGKEFKRLVKEKGKNKQDFSRSFQINRPFTGNMALERQFFNSLDNQGKIQYKKSIDERKLIAQRLGQVISQQYGNR